MIFTKYLTQFRYKHDCHRRSISGTAVLTWNWNGRLVSAGDMKVYTDDRIQVASLIMVDDDYDDDDDDYDDENDDGGWRYESLH